MMHDSTKYRPAIITDRHLYRRNRLDLGPSSLIGSSQDPIYHRTRLRLEHTTPVNLELSIELLALFYPSYALFSFGRHI